MTPSRSSSDPAALTRDLSGHDVVVDASAPETGRSFWAIQQVTKRRGLDALCNSLLERETLDQPQAYRVADVPPPGAERIGAELERA